MAIFSTSIPAFISKQRLIEIYFVACAKRFFVGHFLLGLTFDIHLTLSACAFDTAACQRYRKQMIVRPRDAGMRVHDGNTAKLPLRNNIMCNIMIYQNRLETNLLQLFGHI